MKVGVLEEAFVKPVKVVRPRPLLDGVPVCALVNDAEIGPGAMKVGDPVKGLDDDVCVAHDVLAQIVQAVVYSGQQM